MSRLNRRQVNVYFRDTPDDNRAYEIAQHLAANGINLQSLWKTLLLQLEAGSLDLAYDPLRIVPPESSGTLFSTDKLVNDLITELKRQNIFWAAGAQSEPANDHRNLDEEEIKRRAEKMKKRSW